MANRPMLPVESRMQGDLQVRFGGRLEETYRRKAARRFLTSLHALRYKLHSRFPPLFVPLSYVKLTLVIIFNAF